METLRNPDFNVGLAPAVVVPGHWSGEDHQVVFSAATADTVNLWEIQIPRGSWRVTGEPKRITTGTAMEAQPSVSAGGRLVFSSRSENTDVWSIPLDADAGDRNFDSTRSVRHVGQSQYVFIPFR